MDIHRTGIVSAAFAVAIMGASALFSPRVSNCIIGDMGHGGGACTQPRPGALYHLLPPHLEHLSTWLALSGLAVFLGVMAVALISDHRLTQAGSRGRHVRH